jgi:geranylgeranyl transferase type-2 subunit beta
MNKNHVKYILDLDQEDTVLYDHLRLNALYWGLTSLDLLGQLQLQDLYKSKAFVKSCWNSDGGFGGSPGHDSHLLFTLSAIQIYVLCQWPIEEIKVKVTDYIKTLIKPNGAVAGDSWGEEDTRFVYCAVSGLSLLGSLKEFQDVDKIADYIHSCSNFDGGYGSIPGAESHAGQIFCCVGALTILERQDLIAKNELIEWLAERQLPCGGLNGRPEKKEDVFNKIKCRYVILGGFCHLWQ